MTNEEAIKRLKQVQAEFNENWVDYGGINEAFEKAYQALEERLQGEWIWLGDNPNPDHKWSCNQCGRGVKETENFCPHCGADMIRIRLR